MFYYSSTNKVNTGGMCKQVQLKLMHISLFVFKSLFSRTFSMFLSSFGNACETREKLEIACKHNAMSYFYFIKVNARNAGISQAEYLNIYCRTSRALVSALYGIHDAYS